MQTTPKLRLLSAAILSTFLLAGCGGGSSSTSAPSTNTTQTLTGTAATGAAFSNASIVVNDAIGASKTVTADANGAYSIDVTGMTAPFVINATGIVNGTTTTLVSVMPTAPAAGSSQTVNITPLTNAIAASLVTSGDPQDFVVNPVGNISSITTTKVNQAVTYLRAALSTVATNVGASNFNPLTDAFTADGTKADKLLDSVSVQITPGSGAVINVNSATMIDDSNSQDTNNTSIGGSKITLSTSTVTNTPNTLPSPAATDDPMTVAKAAQTAFNTCFAQPSTVRYANNTLSTACAALVTSDYLNDGMNQITQFGSMITSPIWDNASFSLPNVVRFYAANKALVHVTAVLTDKTIHDLTTVAAKVVDNGAASTISSNGTWKLRGNQRKFNFNIAATAARYEQLNTSNTTDPSQLQTGITLFFDTTVYNGSAVSSSNQFPITAAGGGYVKVTGAGITNGLILSPSSGTCSYLTINNANATLTGNGTGAVNDCSNFLKMNAVSLKGSPSDQTTIDAFFNDSSTSGSTGTHKRLYAYGKVDTSSFNPFEPYTFEIHPDNNGTVMTYTERMQTRPLTATELSSVKFNMVSDASKSYITPGSSSAFTGGATANVSWTDTKGAYMPHHINFKIRGSSGGIVEQLTSVPLKATSTTINAATGTVFPAPAEGHTTSGNTNNYDYSFIGVNSTTEHGMKLFSQAKYTSMQ